MMQENAGEWLEEQCLGKEGMTAFLGNGVDIASLPPPQAGEQRTWFQTTCVMSRAVETNSDAHELMSSAKSLKLPERTTPVNSVSPWATTRPDRVKEQHGREHGWASTVENHGQVPFQFGKAHPSVRSVVDRRH